MDYLRSHMLSKARMFRDSDQVSTIRWFPAAPGAKPYPGWHAFGSPVWEDRNDEPDQFIGPGVFFEGAEWRGKRYPAPPGEHFHGLPEWFEFGLPLSELTEEPFTSYGCRTAAIETGGFSLGGSAPFSYRRVIIPRPLGLCVVSPICFEDLGRQRPPADLVTGSRVGAEFTVSSTHTASFAPGSRVGVEMVAEYIAFRDFPAGARVGWWADWSFTPGASVYFDPGSALGIDLSTSVTLSRDFSPGSRVGVEMSAEFTPG